MKLRLLLIFLFTCEMMPLRSNAQCSISKKTFQNGAICYYEQNEEIYEYQTNDVHRAIWLQIQAQQKSKLGKQWLILLSVCVNTQGQGIGISPLAPRRIEFYFTDGTSLKLIAATIRASSENEIISNQCNYELGIDDFGKLVNKTISTITVIDNRLNVDVDITLPYGGILNEQLACISKAINGSIFEYRIQN